MRAHTKIRSGCSTGRNHSAGIGGLWPFSRLPSLRTTVACLAMGTVIVATAVGSLAQEKELTSSGASPGRTPRSAIETAFAALNASAIDPGAAAQPSARGSCNDFNFSFLNSKCAKGHVRHAARIHRVATLVIGHPAAPPTSPDAQVPSAPPGGQQVARIQTTVATAASASKPKLFDRTPTPSRKAKAALKTAAGKCDPRRGCYRPLSGRASFAG
jgi:hypothetical protein